MNNNCVICETPAEGHAEKINGKLICGHCLSVIGSRICKLVYRKDGEQFEEGGQVEQSIT